MPISKIKFYPFYSSLFWFISLCSFDIQCHAIRQPAIKPEIKLVNVQEKDSGYFLSSQTPNIAPSNVGTATDQPTIPNIPKPNQTLRLSLWIALSLRWAFSPTCSLNEFVFFLFVASILFFTKFLQVINETAFHLFHYQTNIFFIFIQIYKLFFNRFVKFAKVCPTKSIAH